MPHGFGRHFPRAPMKHAACSNYLASLRPNRRQILRAGSLGLLGLSWPELLRGARGDHSRGRLADEFQLWPCEELHPAIHVGWARASRDVDLKPDAPAEIRGEFKPISTRTPGIQISEHFPLLAEQTERLAIVRSMTHTNVDHTTATSFLLTGQPPPTGQQVSQRLAAHRRGAVALGTWVTGRCRHLCRFGRSCQTTCRGSSKKAMASLPAGSARLRSAHDRRRSQRRRVSRRVTSNSRPRSAATG